MNTVRTTETIRPPMIDRASGEYDSLPAPKASAIGIRPMTVASEGHQDGPEPDPDGGGGRPP